MNDNEQLDNLLAEALSEYGAAEPLAGIEDRVLQRLRLQPEHHPWSGWKWAAAAACLSALAVAVWIGMARRTPQSPSTAGEIALQPKVTPLKRDPTPHSADPSMLSQAASERIGVQHSSATTSGRQTNVNAPRAAVFPNPVPLTREEQAFVAALDRHPDALPTTTAPGAAPVIARIEIKPLSDSDKPSGENQ